MEAGHDAWTASDAGLYAAKDDDLSVYAHDRGAALLTHDREFTRKRQARCFGWHVWLKCAEFTSVEVVPRHLGEIVDVLEHRTDVVLEVTATRVRELPSRWS